MLTAFIDAVLRFYIRSFETIGQAAVVHTPTPDSFSQEEFEASPEPG